MLSGLVPRVRFLASTAATAPATLLLLHEAVCDVARAAFVSFVPVLSLTTIAAALAASPAAAAALASLAARVTSITASPGAALSSGVVASLALVIKLVTVTAGLGRFEQTLIVLDQNAYFVGELEGKQLHARELGLVHHESAGGLIPRGLDLLIDNHLADGAMHWREGGE